MITDEKAAIIADRMLYPGVRWIGIGWVSKPQATREDITELLDWMGAATLTVESIMDRLSLIREDATLMIDSYLHYRATHPT